MEKTLKLYQQVGKFEEKSQVLLNYEDIHINLKWSYINNSRVEAVVNGETIIPVVNNKFTIERAILKVGSLDIVVNVYLNDFLVKSFVCEKLFIGEQDKEFCVIPEIEAMKKELLSYKSEVDDLSKQVTRLTELVSALYGFEVKEDK